MLPFYYITYLFERGGLLLPLIRDYIKGSPSFSTPDSSIHSLRLRKHFCFHPVRSHVADPAWRSSGQHCMGWGEAADSEHSSLTVTVHSQLWTAAESKNTKPLFILAHWLVFILMDRISVSALHITQDKGPVLPNSEQKQSLHWPRSVLSNSVMGMTKGLPECPQPTRSHLTTLNLCDTWSHYTLLLS